ncbi:MAG: hypothetical protein ACE5I1_04255 [bacterium]
MLRGNLMIRLIDVVFILLFGFISISEIGPLHSIEPPKATQDYAARGKNNRQKILFLGVDRNGRVILEFPGLKTKNFERIAEAKTYLLQRRELFTIDNAKVQATICSNWNAPIMYAMQIADICDILDLKKSLIVRKIEKPI